MHDKGLVHVGVCALVVNSQGQVLMCHRTTKHGQETWAPPGGHVDPGEHPAETAKRETMEEVGLEVITPKLVGLSSDHFQENGKHYLTPVYMVYAPNPEQARICEPDKCDQIKWVYPKDYPDNLFLSVRNFLHEIGGHTALSLLIKDYLTHKSA